MIPKPSRDSQGKVVGEFYPLQKAELLALRKAKLINNCAYVHLALRYEYPYCNQIIEITPKEFGLRWGIPESSVYEAIAKLRESNVFKIKTGKISIEWSKSEDSQQTSDSENPELLQNSRISQKPCSDKDSEVYTNSDSQQANDSGNPELILEVQNKFQNPRINSELSENRSLKPSHSKNSSKPKISIDLNKSNKKNSLSLESSANSCVSGEREKLSLFEEWKKTATPTEAEEFEEFVRKERIKANKGEILHFASFMGDKYFPEWLDKWNVKKGCKKPASHYENWTEAKHREIAKDYVIDPVTWMKEESWRVKWVEFISSKHPSLFVEVLKESEPPSSAVPPVPTNSSESKQSKLNQSTKKPNNTRPSKPPNKSKFSLKRKLPDITVQAMAREAGDE